MIAEELQKSILQFEKTYKAYLNKDGSINRDGLRLLRRIYFKPFSWNDRKIDEYEAYHLHERTKTQWEKNTEYRRLRDLGAVQE